MTAHTIKQACCYWAAVYLSITSSMKPGMTLSICVQRYAEPWGVADLGLGLDALMSVGSGGGGRAPHVLPLTTLLSNMMLAGYGISSWSTCSRQADESEHSQKRLPVALVNAVELDHLSCMGRLCLSRLQICFGQK